MTQRQRVRRTGAAAAVVAGLVLLGGCSSSRNGDDATASDSAPAGADTDLGFDESGGGSGSVAAPDAEAGATDGGEAASGDSGSSLAVDTVALARTREVIRTGEMWMTVDKVESATDDVRDAADDAGGFVGDEQVHARDGRADVTIRVPATDFDDVRAQIAELGDVGEQSVEAQDVTAEMVDVETRIGSLRASVERLQGLLDGAGDVGQLAMVEGELATRETELEALLGQQRVLRDQVALATLTVHLSEDEVAAPSEDAAGFRDGLRQGWATAIDAGRAVLAAVGFLLPFLPLLLVAAVALRWWSRRHAAPVPPAASTPPAPAAPAA
jgi:Domain of unknown function (DUF4349)